MDERTYRVESYDQTTGMRDRLGEHYECPFVDLDPEIQGEASDLDVGAAFWVGGGAAALYLVTRIN